MCKRYVHIIVELMCSASITLPHRAGMCMNYAACLPTYTLCILATLLMRIVRGEVCV